MFEDELEGSFQVRRIDLFGMWRSRYLLHIFYKSHAPFEADAMNFAWFDFR
jgi:hypothetical protein